MNFVDLSHVSIEDLKSNYLSNGYRYVQYMIDRERNQGYLYCLMFDKDENPINFKYDYDAKLGYAVDYQTNNKDIYGKNIEYKYFKTTRERTKWIDNNSINVVLAQNPAQDFLIDLFSENVEEDDFNKQKLRIHYIDIETEISDSFEYAYTAKNRINLITVYDSHLKIYYTWSLNTVSKSFINKDSVVFEFKLESRLLQHYVNWFSENYPDVITGWNIRNYDIPYIVRRIENVLGKSEAKRLSPFNFYTAKENGIENVNNPNSVKLDVKISGITQLDLLILYRDKFQVKSALAGGYSLDNVGEAENLGNKIHYDGTLKELYLNDWDNFYKYNVRDVNLVYNIEDKLKLIDLARQLVGYGLIPDYERCYGAIAYITGSLFLYAKNHASLVFPTYLNEVDEDLDVRFEGAYVFDIVPKIYKQGIATMDAASLYPSVIRATNISPETYIGKITSKNDDEIIIQTLKGNRTLSNEDYKEKILSKCIISKNDTLFLKPSIKHGIIPRWAAYYFDIRNEAKQGAIIARNKGDNDLADLLKTKDTGLKLMLNSVYGITGSKYCPFFNPHLSQTITRQGRFCNQSSDIFMKNEFKKRYNIDNDYTVLIGGDTDSCDYHTRIDIKGEI